MVAKCRQTSTITTSSILTAPFVDRDAEEGFRVAMRLVRDGEMGRVEEVIDAWFDSGSMPFAQHHYPFEHRATIDEGLEFPADFIAEAVDQTRGWFYTLHVLGALLFDSVAYKNCIVLGHVNDESGRKMSKRLGNVVDPMQVIPETGADALRWYFCASNPELNSRFSGRLVREAAQNFLLPIWNALSFFTIYANLDEWSPGSDTVPFDQRPRSRPVDSAPPRTESSIETTDAPRDLPCRRPRRKGHRTVCRRSDQLVHPPESRSILGASRCRSHRQGERLPVALRGLDTASEADRSVYALYLGGAAPPSGAHSAGGCSRKRAPRGLARA